LYHKLSQVSKIYGAEQRALQARPRFDVASLRVADKSARKLKFF
jgi:hypothetical protein